MNTCQIYPVLQKLFNSLKALDSLNDKDDLIQNIANIDSFFSEFRNITFVAQKNLRTLKQKKIYEKNRKDYLINQKMKWFVDQRNKVTKENPFNLEKDFVVYFYTKKEVVIKHFKSTLNKEFNRENILSTFVNSLRKKPASTYFFTIKLVFLENSKEVDIYKEIIYGIKQMILFVKSLQKDIPCNCDRCKLINKRVSELLQFILNKEITFIWDCEFKDGKLTHAERIELSFGENDSDFMENKIRCPLKNSFFDKDTTTSSLDSKLPQLFFDFSVFHLVIYQKQNSSILPVFMIIYSDDTYILWPFGSTIKTTFFRISYEISQIISTKEIIAVFFAGEYSFREEKVNTSPDKIFVCSMIDNKIQEKSVIFNSNRVNDMTYCKERFSKNEKFHQPIFVYIKKEFKKLIQK